MMSRKAPQVARSGTSAPRKGRKPLQGDTLDGAALRTFRSEAEFQRAVVREATRLGYRTWHCVMPKRSAAGLPDLLLLRPGRSFWCELKSARGRLSPDQVTFIAALRAAGQTVYVWRPSDWDEVLEALA